MEQARILGILEKLKVAQQPLHTYQDPRTGGLYQSPVGGLYSNAVPTHTGMGDSVAVRSAAQSNVIPKAPASVTVLPEGTWRLPDGRIDSVGSMFTTPSAPARPFSAETPPAARPAPQPAAPSNPVPSSSSSSSTVARAPAGRQTVVLPTAAISATETQFPAQQSVIRAMQSQEQSSPPARPSAPAVSSEMQAARDRMRERSFPNAPKTDPGAGSTPGISAITGKVAPQTSAPASAPAAGGEKKQFSSYWQMAKALNEGVTDPSKRVSAAELSKKFDGKMIQKGDTFDLNAIRGGTYAGASGAKGSFDKWQAARTAKAAPASSAMQLATSMAPARQTPNFGSAGQLTPPPATLADVGAASSRVAQAPRVTTPGGGTPPPGAIGPTSVLGTPPPMRSAPGVRSPSEQARTAAAVASARQQVRQGSTASSDAIANNALSATKPLVPQLQTQLGNRPVPRS